MDVGRMPEAHVPQPGTTEGLSRQDFGGCLNPGSQYISYQKQTKDRR
jgi:hypothetical protein